MYIFLCVCVCVFFSFSFPIHIKLRLIRCSFCFSESPTCELQSRIVLSSKIIMSTYASFSFLYSSFLSFVVFLDTDWQAFTETWWPPWAQWDILRFLFWCRTGMFVCLDPYSWHGLYILLPVVYALYHRECWTISLSVNLSRNFFPFLFFSFCYCSQMRIVVITVKKSVKHTGKEVGQFRIQIWLTRSVSFSCFRIYLLFMLYWLLYFFCSCLLHTCFR